MIFPTQVAGQRFLIEVDESKPRFVFQLITPENKKPWPMLSRILPDSIRSRLFDEYRVMKLAETYDLA